MMQLFRCSVLVAICVTLSEARPSETNRERFELNIQEKGTEFQQEVDLDENEGIVTVHVPQHNDVDETYFITDTKKHLTMRVAPQQKMCFLTEKDPEELPSVNVWRKTRDSVQTEQIKDAESKKKKMSYVVTGSLKSQERRDLALKMKTMCDGLPIMKLEPIYKTLLETENLEHVRKMTPFFNYTGVDKRQQGRFKRQLPSEEYLDDCNPRRSVQKCVVLYTSCYFVTDCFSGEETQGREAPICNQKDHNCDDMLCCTLCCMDKVPEGNLTPYCYDLERTKEAICPDYDYASHEITPVLTET